VSNLENIFIKRIQRVILNYPGKSREDHIEVVEYESERDFSRKDRQLIAKLRESHGRCNKLNG